MRGKLTITDGATKLLIYGDENGHDAHCKGCGSLLYSVVRDGAFVHVPLGTLVDTPSISSAGAHLCRLQSAVVHGHRRPSPIRRISDVTGG